MGPGPDAGGDERSDASVADTGRPHVRAPVARDVSDVCGDTSGERGRDRP